MQRKKEHNGRIRFMSQPEADQAGKNWFRVQNIALQKKEGKAGMQEGWDARRIEGKER